MSKTKGNVVDPLELIDRYGTDACRIALLISAAPGADIALKEDRLAAARAFANKLWNASRMLSIYMEKSGITQWAPTGDSAFAEGGSVATEDAWIFERLRQCSDTVNRALEQHRYHEAAQSLWDFVWKEFCDWYLEVKKLRFKDASGLDSHWTAALTVYETTLRLLHPFMPFITEELWQRLVHRDDAQARQPVSISLAVFPQLTNKPSAADRNVFGLLQSVVTAARELRADHKLDPKRVYAASLLVHGSTMADADVPVIQSLARLDFADGGKGSSNAGALLRSTPEFDLRIEAEAPPADGTGTGPTRDRIQKEIDDLRKPIENLRRQLADEEFLKKAPAKVIETMRGKLADYEAQLKKNLDLLSDEGGAQA
jgi:valyl-tRNA synthetase